MRKSEYDKLKKESYLKKSKSNQSIFEHPHLVLNILYKNYINSKKQANKNSGDSTIF